MDEAAREINDRAPKIAAEWEETRAWEVQNR